MFYLIYKTTSTSGKYYIGRHSTKKVDDNYFGSGKWIRSIKDKTSLTREVLEFCESEAKLKEVEIRYLGEHVGKENCMNFNRSSCGFSSGDLNPSCTPEARKRTSARVSGAGNPAKNPETARKMSQSQLGKLRGPWEHPMSDQGRANVSKGRTGITYSEEGKKLLVKNRKKTYEAQGVTPYVPTFTGLSHSDETIIKMRESALAQEKIECENCGTLCDPGNYKRWHGDKCKKKA